MKEFPNFNMKKDCSSEQNKQYLNHNKKIAMIALFMITLGGLYPILLYNGTETTLIFENDVSLGGVVEIGKILTRSEMPQTPFPIFCENNSIYYADVDNISSAWIELIGFVIIEKPLLDLISQNLTLFIEFHLFVIYSSLGMKNPNELLFPLESLSIAKYIAQYPIIVVIGNYQENWLHKIVYKFTAQKYVIPFFQIKFHVQGIESQYQFPHYSFWTRALLEPDLAYMKAGAWEITPTDFKYNIETALFMVTKNMSMLPTLTKPAIYTDCDITRTFDFSYALTPITKYELK